jgi:hypothetical protein
VGEELADLIEGAAAKDPSKAYDVRNACRRATLDVIGKAAFGFNFGALGYAAARLREGRGVEEGGGGAAAGSAGAVTDAQIGRSWNRFWVSAAAFLGAGHARWRSHGSWLQPLLATRSVYVHCQPTDCAPSGRVAPAPLARPSRSQSSVPHSARMFWDRPKTTS